MRLPALTPIFGGSEGANILYSQINYWMERTNYDDGVFKTNEEWQAETGLTRTKFENARKILMELGLLIVKKNGYPVRTFYRLDFRRFDKLVRSYFEEQDVISNKSINCGKPAINMQETCKTDAGNLQNI